MKEFTVIGFYPDTKQRFCTTVTEKNSDDAETAAFEEADPGLIVCGVLSGRCEITDVDKRNVSDINGELAESDDL